MGQRNGSRAISGIIHWLCTILVVFITLRVIGLIDWSWWAVLAPVYCGVVAYILYLIISCAVDVYRENRYTMEEFESMVREIRKEQEEKDETDNM